MKKIVSVLLGIVLIFSLAACGATDSQTTENTKEEIQKELNIPADITLRDSDVLEGKKIGCNIIYKGDEWCAAVFQVIEALAEYYGCECECVDSDHSSELFAKQVEDMLADGCDLIFADPVMQDEDSAVLNKVVESKTPLFIYNEIWAGGEKAVTNILWDNYYSGVLAANYFLDYVRENIPDRKCTVIELTVKNSYNVEKRFEGFHDTVEKAKDVEVDFIDRLDTKGEIDVAKEALSSISEQYDFVLTDTNNAALGALELLRSQDNGEVKIISMGGYGKEVFELLNNNDKNYLAFVSVDPWELVVSMFNAAIDYYEGKSVENCININTELVDANNVGDVWRFE